MIDAVFGPHPSLSNGRDAISSSLLEMLDGLAASVTLLSGQRSEDGVVCRLVDQVAQLFRELSPEDPPATSPVSFPGLIGEALCMRELFERMAAVAPSDVTVHILGETGTGKERVAEAIHSGSNRRRGPFVAVNASSLSDELFESQFFGHSRGAFTNAVRDHAGYAGEAEGGTLFIDEVTDLSIRAQSKLLRFLEQREYRRVGEAQLRRANVRIVTASNVSLESRVASGQLREDLMYRLNPVSLLVPPLRERGSDILRLARHFLRCEAEKLQRPLRKLTQSATDALLRYAWPGNVRELRNEMIRLLFLPSAGPICQTELSVLVVARTHQSCAYRVAYISFERDFISRALASHDGNRSRTAAALGLTRQGLLAKMRRLDLMGVGKRS